MIYIAHRGNVSGVKPALENSPDYIDEAIHAGFDVEIDLRIVDGRYWLGHDKPQYEVPFQWLMKKSGELWIHLKDIQSFIRFNDQWKNRGIFNYFYHEDEKFVLTSEGYIWIHPNTPYMEQGIIVLPEQSQWTFQQIMSVEGVCSNWVSSWRNSEK